MARQLDGAIIVLRHLRKTGGRALYAGLGGIGAARAAFVVGRDPDDGLRVLAPVKNNLGPLPASLGYRVVRFGPRLASDELSGSGRLPEPPKIPTNSWINPPEETEASAQ